MLAAELPGDAAERGRQRGAHLRLRVARQRGQGFVQMRRIPEGGARACSAGGARHAGGRKRAPHGHCCARSCAWVNWVFLFVLVGTLWRNSFQGVLGQPGCRT